MTIEETFQKLDEILSRMEKPASLEAAFSDYEQGVQLIRDCSAQINEIEQKVITLQTQEPAEGE